MWNAKKSLAAIFSAGTLTLASLSPTFASYVGAVEVTGTATESTQAETENSTDMSLSDTEMQQLIEEIESNADSTIGDTETDYYSDDYYDTDGNATLIKNEQIIYDSDEMQFIAVTTKDGNVFYILINYSAEGDEENVFFLNKVDDFDLYSLLYAGNEDEENIDPQQQAEKYADAALDGNTDSEPETEVSGTDVEVTATTEKAPAKSNSNMLILAGVAVVAVAGGAFLLFRSGKLGKFGKKKNTVSDDMDEDYEDYGEVENEDE